MPYLRHLEIHPPTCPSEGQVPVFKTPSYVFTNGTVYFQDQNGLFPSTYKCLDRYKFGDDGKTTSQVPAAMVCQTIMENSNKVEAKAEDEPKCEGQPEFCIPKCCPRDEIFVLDHHLGNR